VNTIDNPNAPFRTCGRKAFELSFMNGIRWFLLFVCPKLRSFFKIKSVDTDVEAFILNLVKDTIEYREKNKISRKDLMQVMIQLRNSGNIENDDGDWDTTIADEKHKTFTLNEISAQAWVFYLAGFETSSATTSFCLYELAKNVDIQRKLQKEIDEITEKYNGEITYDSLSEMKYLDMCIDETLRKHSVIPLLNRQCTIDYPIPGTNVIIEKGTAILIPALGLQNDAKYYPEPEKFIPERFHADNLKSFEERPYMPFGDGPRNCIGLRLGKLQTKVGLCVFLQNFTYNLVNTDELKISPKSIVLQPTTGINLKISKRVNM